MYPLKILLIALGCVNFVHVYFIVHVHEPLEVGRESSLHMDKSFFNLPCLIINFLNTSSRLKLLASTSSTVTKSMPGRS